MQYKEKIVLPAILTALMLTAFALYAFIVNVQSVVASAPIYESNLSTTTRSTSASATASYVACTGPCQLGSIVVNQVGTAGWVRVWNATSTATSSYQTTDVATSSLQTKGIEIAQVLGSSDAAGTLVYDVQASLGIVIETSTGFDGQYTITYKK